ncbi:cyclomaltodextrinase C-terminal domain-containing protein [Cellulophaga baltica 4]|nr:cyclomaltodextrinase C-terminal domain-containing protein [Cellulophaga baltica 4]
MSLKQKDAQEFVKKLLNWRKSTTVIHSGSLKHFAPKNKEEVYVFFRYNNQKKIMVILNKNTEDVLLDLTTYREILGDSLSGREVLNDIRINAASKLSVKARNAMIIEVE